MFVCYLNYGKTLSNFAEVNDKACQLLGYNSAELLKLNPLHVIFENKEDDLLKFIDRVNSEQSYISNVSLSDKNKRIIPAEMPIMDL